MTESTREEELEDGEKRKNGPEAIGRDSFELRFCGFYWPLIKDLRNECTGAITLCWLTPPATRPPQPVAIHISADTDFLDGRTAGKALILFRIISSRVRINSVKKSLANCGKRKSMDGDREEGEVVPRRRPRRTTHRNYNIQRTKLQICVANFGNYPQEAQ